MSDPLLHISRKTFDKLARAVGQAGLTIAQGAQRKDPNVITKGLEKLAEANELIDGIETGAIR